jgi:amidase
MSPSALQYATYLDTLRAQGKKKGPLHGIPIIVKDNIGTQYVIVTLFGQPLLSPCLSCPLKTVAEVDNGSLLARFEDGMNTTAGSYALLNSVVAGDSTVVAKLKAAGAIILGKANLSQW